MIKVIFLLILRNLFIPKPIEKKHSFGNLVKTSMGKETLPMKPEWKDLTDTFSEKQRHYNGKYLEKDMVLDGKVEVSYFSEPKGDCEIYVSFGNMVGVVYVTPENYEETFQNIQEDFEKEYIKLKGNVSDIRDGFIHSCVKKYSICMPDDLFVNFDFDEFVKALDKIH